MSVLGSASSSWTTCCAACNRAQGKVQNDEDHLSSATESTALYLVLGEPFGHGIVRRQQIQDVRSSLGRVRIVQRLEQVRQGLVLEQRLRKLRSLVCTHRPLLNINDNRARHGARLWRIRRPDEPYKALPELGRPTQSLHQLEQPRVFLLQINVVERLVIDSQLECL